MVMKRRAGSTGDSSPRVRSRPKKRASKKLLYKVAPARTRTSLVGATIYQPDLKPSAVGRKLLEALEN
jgi:hypothetical protein